MCKYAGALDDDKTAFSLAYPQFGLMACTVRHPISINKMSGGNIQIFALWLCMVLYMPPRTPRTLISKAHRCWSIARPFGLHRGNYTQNPPVISSTRERMSQLLDSGSAYPNDYTNIGDGSGWTTRLL